MKVRRVLVGRAAIMSMWGEERKSTFKEIIDEIDLADIVDDLVIILNSEDFDSLNRNFKP